MRRGIISILLFIGIVVTGFRIISGRKNLVIKNDAMKFEAVPEEVLQTAVGNTSSIKVSIADVNDKWDSGCIVNHSGVPRIHFLGANLIDDKRWIVRYESGGYVLARYEVEVEKIKENWTVAARRALGPPVPGNFAVNFDTISR